MKKAAQKGFTLIELLIVIIILGILGTLLLLIIDPAEKLAQARDSGRISGVTQIGRAVAAYSSTHDSTHPDPNQWGEDLEGSSEINSIPAGIPYNINSATPCQTNVEPSTNPTYCYALDESGNGYGALVFAKLESQSQLTKCNLIGDTYIVHSTADGKTGIICESVDPSPRPAGTMIYVE